MTAFDATVKLADYASASIGTDLGPRLLAEARRAAAESQAATENPGGDGNDELQKCLVAILCAQAAVEAQMNAVGDALDSPWWATQERCRIGLKWRTLAERRFGAKPPRSDPTYKAVLRLTRDRNLVAHFRGLLQPDKSYAVAGSPVTSRGGISPVRAYFDAARAKGAVAAAELALLSL